MQWRSSKEMGSNQPKSSRGRGLGLFCPDQHLLTCLAFGPSPPCLRPSPRAGVPARAFGQGRLWARGPKGFGSRAGQPWERCKANWARRPSQSADTASGLTQSSVPVLRPAPAGGCLGPPCAETAQSKLCAPSPAGPAWRSRRGACASPAVVAGPRADPRQPAASKTPWSSAIASAYSANRNSRWPTRSRAL